MKWSAMFEKLKRVPAFVQSLLVGLSVLFVGMVTMMDEFDQFLVEFARLIMESEIDTSGMNMDALASSMAWVFYIGAFIFGILFFELIAYIVYRSMYGRRQIDGDRGYVMTVIRSAYIACNLVSGVLKLFGFLNINAVVYISATVDVVIFPVVFTLAYAHLLKHGNVYVDRVGMAYQTLFWIYFGIMAAISLYELIRVSVNLPSYTVHALVGVILQFVLTLGTGAALWFTARNRFMKIQKDPPDIFGGDDDGEEIFRGYGM